MNKDTLNYIRKHKDLYRLLREESHYYEMIFQNPSSIYQLEAIAREKYHTRFSDYVDKIGDKISLLSSLLDVFQ